MICLNDSISEVFFQFSSPVFRSVEQSNRCFAIGIINYDQVFGFSRPAFQYSSFSIGLQFPSYFCITRICASQGGSFSATLQATVDIPNFVEQIKPDENEICQLVHQSVSRRTGTSTMNKAVVWVFFFTTSNCWMILYLMWGHTISKRDHHSSTEFYHSVFFVWPGFQRRSLRGLCG